MSKIKENRVLGARGIGVTNSNLNSGFDGRPKSLANGDLFNSDVSAKYLDRDYWHNAGYSVLIKKRIKTDDDGNLYSTTLEETLVDKLDAKKNPITQIINDFVDVQNFGATIATKKLNVGITGVVQYHQGVNKIAYYSVLTQDILSPFGPGNNKKQKAKVENGEEVTSTTATNIGKHTFVDKALYVQSFSVNPANLNNMIEAFGSDKVKGYKEESYEKFKKAVLCSATLCNTRTKAGCCDEFSIFINLKENSIYALNDIGRFIDIHSEEDRRDKAIIDFTKLKFLNDIKDVETIEIFYNSLSCEVKHEFTNVVVKDLLSCY